MGGLRWSVGVIAMVYAWCFACDVVCVVGRFVWCYLLCRLFDAGLGGVGLLFWMLDLHSGAGCFCGFSFGGRLVSFFVGFGFGGLVYLRSWWLGGVLVSVGLGVLG